MINLVNQTNKLRIAFFNKSTKLSLEIKSISCFISNEEILS